MTASHLKTAPVAIYRLVHCADMRDHGATAGTSGGFPRRRPYFDNRGRLNIWEKLEPLEQEGGVGASGDLRFLLVVGRKYRLCVAQPVVDSPVRLSASVVVENKAGTSQPVPEPKLLRFDVEGPRSSQGQEGGSRQKSTTKGIVTESLDLRLQSDGIADKEFGFSSSTQALPGVWYELRAVYGETGQPVSPGVRLLVGTRTKINAVRTASVSPAPPVLHALRPASSSDPSLLSPPGTPAGQLTPPSPSPSHCSSSSPPPPTPPLPPPPAVKQEPPSPPPAGPARGAKSGCTARSRKLGGLGARHAARRKREVTPAPAAGAGEEEAAAGDDLADPFSLLVIASESMSTETVPIKAEGDSQSQAPQRPPEADAGGKYRWMDSKLVASLEFLFLKARTLFASGGGGSGLEAPSSFERRPPQRLRRSSAAFEDAEGLLRRIDRALCERTAPVDVKAPSSTDPDALLRAVAGQPPPRLCQSPEERRAFEDSVAEAIAGVEEACKSAAGASDAAVNRLRGLLGSARLLCSRYLHSHSGVRELRRALLTLRAAARSVAPERRVASDLVRAAASAIVSTVAQGLPSNSAFLVEACERSWRLADALVPAIRGIVPDLMMVPCTEILSLSLLAAEALELVKGPEPMAYATGLFNHGYRLMQCLREEEACAMFYSALATMRRHGFDPCLLEARTLACLTACLNRTNMFEEAAKVEGMMYWFTEPDTPEERNAHRECLEVMLHVASRRGDKPRILALTSELHEITCARPPPLAEMGADAELLQWFSMFCIAFSNIHCHRLTDAIRVYREAVDLLAGNPHLGASFVADIITAWTPIFRGLTASSMASGLRVAVAIHRLVDWGGRTPVLAHLLFALGSNYAAMGETAKALATLTEAAAEYGRFGALFPPDHPRILAVHEAADACRALLASGRP